ncbi:NIPA-like protein 2 isoform X2 [Hemicordylus capensis]|uniref:NIPA-like protein 2 isoform X2 n=1 Tax=Hemicordylus capensis TaxID=884348 RepID=UPI002303F0AB|nr:NIPA-like protein 2 isoform X2 [Hemicordylus capensis]
MATLQLTQNVTFEGEEMSSGFLSSGWYYANQTLLLGILLAITGNFLISISLTVQKSSHLLLARQADQKSYYKSKLWWCGIVLMGIGETGNFAAYGFASVMLIAPLGSVAVIGSAVASVLFLKGSIRPEGILGGTVTVTGIFLLVTFAPHVTQEPTARQIQTDIVSWRFLIYVILEVIIFCILLYFYKRRQVKHIMLPLTMVALLASLSIICVKAVAAMIILSVKGNMQLTHPIFYIMLTIMVVTCVFQVKFLDEALQLYGTAEVIPMNYVFFTVSAVMAGAIFYQEFQAASPLSGFMFLFGCFLSFLGVFIITQNGGKDHLKSFYIDYGHIPGKKMSSKIQPDSHSLSYGSCCNEGDSVKAQSILNSS